MTFLSHRQFHTEPSSKYWLPLDDKETKRLVGQHESVKELFGGNIPSPLIEVIGPDLKKGGKFFDLCCGTGIFITEIAVEYPNCECIGMDMVDIFQKETKVQNLTFQKGNILKSLPFEDNSFDVVSLNYGILAFTREQWITVIKEIKRVLKEGGYMISREPGRFFTNDPFIKSVIDKFVEKTNANGQVADISEQLKIMLSNAGYDETVSITKPVYLGRPGSLNKKYLKNTINIIESLLPNMANDLQVEPENYEEFLKKVEKHLNEPNTIRSATFTYGRKPFYSNYGWDFISEEQDSNYQIKRGYF